MVVLAVILVIVVVVEGGVDGGKLWEVIGELIVVGVVLVVGSGISYLSLRRGAEGGGVSIGEALFNWSVVVLVAFTAFLFLIS